MTVDQKSLDEQLQVLLQDLNGDTLQAWLGSLPIGKDSLVIKAQVLTKLIVASNKNPPAMLSFYQVLNASRHACYETAKSLLVYYFRDEPEAFFDESEKAKACLLLLKTVSIAYTSVIDKAEEIKDKQVLASLMHHALASYHPLFMAHYRLHIGVSNSHWHRLHHLFLSAVRQSFASFEMDDEELFPNTKKSIKEIYNACLLLGAGQLNHLTDTQVSVASKFFQEHISLVTISKTPSESSVAQLVVDVEHGTPPELIPGSDVQVGKCYFLLLEKLVEKIQEVLDQEAVKKEMEAEQEAEAEPATETEQEKVVPAQKPIAAWDAVDTHLLEHLLNALSHVQPEGQLKQDASKEVDIRLCSGLDAIHFYLIGGMTLKEFVGNKASLSIVYDEEEDISDRQAKRSGDVWSSFLSDPKGKLYHTEMPEALGFHRDFKDLEAVSIDKNYPITDIKMFGDINSGVYLQWTGPKGKTVRRGEFLGLKVPDEKVLLLARVTWLEYKEGQITHTGLQILGTQGIPIASDVPLRFGKGENYAPAILLPPDKERSYIYIVMKAGEYEKNEFIDISQEGTYHKLRLGKLKSQNDDCQIYDCGILLTSDIEEESH